MLFFMAIFFLCNFSRILEFRWFENKVLFMSIHVYEKNFLTFISHDISLQFRYAAIEYTKYKYFNAFIFFFHSHIRSISLSSCIIKQFTLPLNKCSTIKSIIIYFLLFFFVNSRSFTHFYYTQVNSQASCDMKYKIYIILLNWSFTYLYICCYK